MTPVIELVNYTKIIREQVILDHIDLSLERGRIYGFIGPNGSGKTMLFRAICGFILPTEGHAMVNGLWVGKDVDFPPNIGLMIEQPNFIGELSALNNLRTLAEIQGRIGDIEIKDALFKVGLDPALKKKVRAFSLGMKQRLALAQAIMEEPEIIILDEPMNSLDKEGCRLARELLLEAKGRGATVLLCSHVTEDIRTLCDEVWEMDNGKIARLSKGAGGGQEG